jgi:hypothetical protein
MGEGIIKQRYMINSVRFILRSGMNSLRILKFIESFWSMQLNFHNYSHDTGLIDFTIFLMIIAFFK